MFPGFGYGVDVTVAELQPSMPSTGPAAGVVERRARLHELLPADGFTCEGLAREIQRAVVTRRELERLAARGCPTHPDRSCGCPVLDAPPPVDRYRPTAAQQRFTSTRDRSCRHPGCRNRAVWADLDHVLPNADGGATDRTNLASRKSIPPGAAEHIGRQVLAMSKVWRHGEGSSLASELHWYVLFLPSWPET